MKNLFALCLICLGLAITSCGDDSGLSITINSPSNGSSFSPGDRITISGTAMDDVEVTDVSLEGQGDLTTTGTLDLTGAPDPTNIPFTVDLDLPAEIAAADYVVRFTAQDNDGNTESTDFEFTVQ